MATTINDYNIGKITQDALMASLKDAVIDNLTRELVDEFRIKAEEAVRKEVDKVGIKGVQHFRDLAKMRDEVKIYCEWTNT